MGAFDAGGDMLLPPIISAAGVGRGLRTVIPQGAWAASWRSGVWPASTPIRYVWEVSSARTCNSRAVGTTALASSTPARPGQAGVCFPDPADPATRVNELLLFGGWNEGGGPWVRLAVARRVTGGVDTSDWAYMATGGRQRLVHRQPVIGLPIWGRARARIAVVRLGCLPLFLHRPATRFRLSTASSQRAGRRERRRSLHRTPSGLRAPWARTPFADWQHCW